MLSASIETNIMTSTDCNPIDDCNENHDHRDLDPGVDEYYHVGLSDGYPCEGINDGLDALDHNSDVDYNDDELDDGFYEVDDATSVHDNVDLDDDVDDPDFPNSLVSINDTNINDYDDVGKDEYTHHHDQYSHYDINDYSQVVVKSHDMKHSDH